MTVATATGPVAPEQLGATLMHEHLFLRDPDIALNAPDGWDADQAVADAVDRLVELKARGIDTIVDLSVIGHGRDPVLQQRVAQQSPVTLVVATGVYTYDELPFGLRFRGPGSAPGGGDPLVELFVHDLTEGVGDTGMRAGIIKVATDRAGVTAGVERVLRAAGAAHLRTGVTISTHTDAHTHRGLDQQRVLAEEGVDLGRVVIGHSGDTDDLDYLQRLVDAGSYLGMDRFGIPAPLTFEQRVGVVADMCRRGYAERMVLSHDAMCHSNWFGDVPILDALPQWRFTHISDDVLPALRARGVTEAQLTTMLVDNPRRLLTPL